MTERVEEILAALGAGARSFTTGKPVGERKREKPRNLITMARALERERELAERYPDARARAAVARRDADRERHETAEGVATRPRKASSGRMVHVGNAVAGMPAYQYTALEFFALGDRAARQRVAARLERWASKPVAKGRTRRELGQWPPAVRRRCCACGRAPSTDYVPDLVELALQELERPGDLDTHRAQARWFGVSIETWRRTMRRPWQAIRSELHRTIDEGLGHIARRVGEA